MTKCSPSSKSNCARRHLPRIPLVRKGPVMKKVGWFVRPELPLSGPCEKPEPGSLKPKRSTRSSRNSKPVKKRYKVVKRKRKHNQVRIAPGSKLKSRRRRTKQIKYKYLRRKLYYKHPAQRPSNPVQELPIAAPAPVHPNPGDLMSNLLAPDIRHTPQPLSPDEICVPDHPGHHFHGGAPIAVVPESVQDHIPAAVIPAENLYEQAAADSKLRDSIMGAEITPDSAFSNLLALEADSDHQLNPDMKRLKVDESVGTIVNADTIALLAQQVRNPEDV